MNDESIRELWQEQEGESKAMDIAELRKKAAALERRVRNRNWREYGAALLVAAACVAMLVTASPLYVKAGALLSIAGMAMVCRELYRKGSAVAVAAEAVVSRDWYRKELERQRDLLRSVWRWYLGPMIPGLLVWCVGGLWHHPERRGRILVTYLVGAVFFVAVGKMNAHAARRLDKEIHSL
ncbi:MAG: hypothetical protein JST93_33405 [Acidobacteria bacterium]|nr:hypothetical protein [Acidobacteriota bacterium]